MGATSTKTLARRLSSVESVDARRVSRDGALAGRAKTWTDLAGRLVESELRMDRTTNDSDRVADWKRFFHGADDRHRLCQETVLSIGRAPALRTPGCSGVRTFHLDAGQAALAPLELCRDPPRPRDPFFAVLFTKTFELSVRLLDTAMHRANSRSTEATRRLAQLLRAPSCCAAAAVVEYSSNPTFVR
jgi:hypothetical protein